MFGVISQIFNPVYSVGEVGRRKYAKLGGHPGHLLMLLWLGRFIRPSFVLGCLRFSLSRPILAYFGIVTSKYQDNPRHHPFNQGRSSAFTPWSGSVTPIVDHQICSPRMRRCRGSAPSMVKSPVTCCELLYMFCLTDDCWLRSKILSLWFFCEVTPHDPTPEPKFWHCIIQLYII